MGFVQEASEVKYYKLDDLSPGMSLTATYDGNSTHGEFNTKTYYFIDGSSKIGINGCADLDKRLTQVERGETVKLHYLGKKSIETKHGKVKAHKFNVARIGEDGKITPVLIPSAKGGAEAEDMGVESENSFRS